jgi:hypothetical protein
MVCCALSAAAAGISWADIVLWEGDPNYCQIVQAPLSTVTITGQGAFKLRAYGPGGLEDINKIWAPGVFGSVHVSVMADPNDPNIPCCEGARHVHILDLSGATLSFVETVLTSGNAADWDDIPLRATQVGGNVQVGGGVPNGIVTDYLEAYIVCDNLGDVAVNVGGSASQRHAGSITITGSQDYAGQFYLNGSLNNYIHILGGLDSAASIEVTGDVVAGIQIGWEGSRPTAGTVTIGGDLGSTVLSGGLTGHLSVAGSIVRFDGFPYGLELYGPFDPNASIDVAGDLIGPLLTDSVAGTLHVGGQLTGGTIGGIAQTGVVDVRGIDHITFNGLVEHSLSVTDILTDCQVNGDVKGDISAWAISGLTVVGKVSGSIVAEVDLQSLTLSGANGRLAGLVRCVQPEPNNLSTLGDVQIDAGIDEGGVLEGDLVAWVTVNGPIAGTVRATTALDGSILGTWSLPSTGLIDVQGNLYGAVAPTGPVYGSIVSQGHIFGWVWIQESAPGEGDGDLYGSIECNASVAGKIHLEGSIRGTGSITVDGALIDMYGEMEGGHILIDRALRDQASIVVSTQDNMNTEFIAVRYPGYSDGDVSDPWDPNATVTILGEVCHGDRPDLNVRSVRPCKADMNGDGLLDFDDIDPFIEAFDPQTYSFAHPGLGGTAYDSYHGGSRIFHGDLDCSGEVDFDDVGPFIARISCDPPYCSPECGDCGGDMLTSEQLATGMRAHVPAARMPALRSFVAQVIAHHQSRGDMQQRAYWAQVLAGLAQ